MGKFIICLTLSALIAFSVFIGCSGAASSEVAIYKTGERTDGVSYEELSDRFKIIVYPTLVISEGKEKYIDYQFSLENKSEQAYKNIIITVSMNEKLDQYIAAGVLPLPFSKIDLAAQSAVSLSEGEAKGVDIDFKQLLSDEQFMCDAGLDYKSILDLGKDFEVWVQWDGGEEKYALSAPVVDKTE